MPFAALFETIDEEMGNDSNRREYSRATDDDDVSLNHPDVLSAFQATPGLRAAILKLEEAVDDSLVSSEGKYPGVDLGSSAQKAIDEAGGRYERVVGPDSDLLVGVIVYTPNNWYVTVTN